jgi:hypothetical protein
VKKAQLKTVAGKGVLASVNPLRARFFGAGQGGFEDLKKSILLPNNRVGWIKLLFQRQAGLGIGKAKNSLAIQQFHQVELNLIVTSHYPYCSLNP